MWPPPANEVPQNTGLAAELSSLHVATEAHNVSHAQPRTLQTSSKAFESFSLNESSSKAFETSSKAFESSSKTESSRTLEASSKAYESFSLNESSHRNFESSSKIFESSSRNETFSKKETSSANESIASDYVKNTKARFLNSCIDAESQLGQNATPNNANRLSHSNNAESLPDSNKSGSLFNGTKQRDPSTLHTARFEDAKTSRIKEDYSSSSKQNTTSPDSYQNFTPDIVATSKERFNSTPPDVASSYDQKSRVAPDITPTFNQSIPNNRYDSVTPDVAVPQNYGTTPDVASSYNSVPSNIANDLVSNSTHSNASSSYSHVASDLVSTSTVNHSSASYGNIIANDLVSNSSTSGRLSNSNAAAASYVAPSGYGSQGFVSAAPDLTASYGNRYDVISFLVNSLIFSMEKYFDYHFWLQKTPLQWFFFLHIFSIELFRCFITAIFPALPLPRT